MMEQQSTFKLRTLVKNIVIEWFQNSTSHALPNIFRTDSILLKIIWIICLLASGSYCFYSITLSLQDYLSYPTYISTQIVKEIPTQFPAVTICNLKTVNKTVAKSYINPRVPQLPLNIFGSTLERIYTQQYALRTLITTDQSLNEVSRRLLGYQLNDMLISCFFNYMPCNANDFTYSYHPIYGNCYTFNKGITDNGTVKSVEKVTTAGMMFGLMLELFLGEPSIETYFEHSDGVIVSVHNSTNLPFTEDIRRIAAAGADTDMVVTRNFIKKLEKPYGDCLMDITSDSTFSSVYFDYIVRTRKMKYSQNQCFGLCLQQKVINLCNCSNTLLPVFIENANFCFNKHEVECFTRTVNDFSKQNDASGDCDQACPFICETVDYEVTTFSSYYPTDYYKNNLLETNILKSNNITLSNIERAVAKVNVYYKNMNYIVTQEKISTSTEAFFSNIGGTLGLYLGISLLSFVEIVELIVVLLFALCDYKRSRNSISSNQKIFVKSVSNQDLTLN